MFIIENSNTKGFVKYTGKGSYPFDMVLRPNEATEYSSFTHANEVAFWHLDNTESWVVVNLDTGKHYRKELGKYHPS
jgi:hypothetical protein